MEISRIRKSPPQLLQGWLSQAIAGAVPDVARISQLLPDRLNGRLVVVGAGKATPAMLAALWRAVPSAWLYRVSGIIAIPYGLDCSCLPDTSPIRIIEAAHPIPDQASMRAARAMFEATSGLSRDDLVIALISGGGSSLLAAPAEGIQLAEKQALGDALLKAGARISEINTVRKRVSAIKGGRLALNCHPARSITFLVSDTPGNDLAAVASGPTLGDPTTSSEAQAILDRYGIPVPRSVASLLARQVKTGERDTPAPDDPRFIDHRAHAIVTPRCAFNRSAVQARADGFTVLDLGDRIEGEARIVARLFAGIALSIYHDATPIAMPALLLSGGETSVTVTGTGRGGRNSEFLLALALALDGADGIWALACDTDGIDGMCNNAGATIGPDTLTRARAKGLDASQYLQNNDAYGFFAALDDLVITGATGTNVNDFRAILIQHPVQ